MDPMSLIVGLFLGLIGGAYFLYGKKEANAFAMLSGAALCIIPYFIPNLILLIVISAAFMAAPIYLGR